MPAIAVSQAPDLSLTELRRQLAQQRLRIQHLAHHILCLVPRQPQALKQFVRDGFIRPGADATAAQQAHGQAHQVRVLGINLAAISAAICTGPHAHEDRNKRYTAAVWCGVFYGIAGVFGATLAALFAALPKELVLSIAALALFGSIINGLSIAMNEPKEREAALITFMVTASGLTLFSIGSAFWGIVAGVLTLLILNGRKA